MRFAAWKRTARNASSADFAVGSCGGNSSARNHSLAERACECIDSHQVFHHCVSSVFPQPFFQSANTQCSNHEQQYKKKKKKKKKNHVHCFAKKNTSDRKAQKKKENKVSSSRAKFFPGWMNLSWSRAFGINSARLDNRVCRHENDCEIVEAVLHGERRRVGFLSSSLVSGNTDALTKLSKIRSKPGLQRLGFDCLHGICCLKEELDIFLRLISGHGPFNGRRLLLFWEQNNAF
jgi:hypothetical protein